ncbi:MAG: hypothetical protein JWQ09_3983, partial [Segetibacter sp.]|nr:hypothetical protein [Segetibacter sp.]
ASLTGQATTKGAAKNNVDYEKIKLIFKGLKFFLHFL